MDFGRRLTDLPERMSRLALGLALALVVAITVADVISPKQVYLSPMLVVAPALVASFAGPWRTAGIAMVALGAQVIAAAANGGAATKTRVWQLAALFVVSVLLVFFSYVRQQRGQELSRARLVAETAQRVLLRPPPPRVGPLRIAWQYLAAENDTQFGGDLFAVTRCRPAASRAIIGDVRGHGLPAIAEASAILGSFREAARRSTTLDELAAVLEESVGWDLQEIADSGQERGENFATALLLEVPDQGDRVYMTCCGHPPPLLISADGQVTATRCADPAPPLGLGFLSGTTGSLETLTYSTGDTLLLYTDGVIEARSPQGAFYSLVERVAGFPHPLSPDALVQHLRQDLLAHTGGRLSDDAALLALSMAPEDDETQRYGGNETEAGTAPSPAGVRATSSTSASGASGPSGAPREPLRSGADESPTRRTSRHGIRAHRQHRLRTAYAGHHGPSR
ncbi:MAG: serine/threonine-protein phosphatase [Actinomycetia bacterium]|nr:serine/threonine-protein phosphatase [Actinomycetes bacterium]